jgi:hypothetical protein
MTRSAKAPFSAVPVALLGAALFAALLWGLTRFAGAAPVTTRDLWLHRDRWTGRRVTVVGTLKVFLPDTKLRHYALEDRRYRAGVVGLPPSMLTPLLGRRVRATGVFVFDETRGGVLESPTLTAPGP